jgi:curved DNA-binding protein CbpA
MSLLSKIAYRQFHSNLQILKETHYDILKIPHDASIPEIKNKFKKLSLRLHPDMLKSQGLTEDEIKSKSDQYLKVKKSYEILSDDKKRNDYDLHLGIKRREGSSTNSFFKRPGNTFHFHERNRYNDIPHFDTKKHQERNERVEKRFMYNQKINQTVDTFSRDLYKRNLGANGPRKGIYKQYKNPSNFQDNENEGKKIAIKLFGGVFGIFVIWYILCGNFTTEEPELEKKKEEKINIVSKDSIREELNKENIDFETKHHKIEDKNITSRSGNMMNVNNKYGLMLIKGGDLKERDELEVLEEQISETAE